VSKEPVVGYEDSGDMPLRVAALSGLSSTMAPFGGGNYARSSQLFESGFSGFPGLTITSMA